MAEEAEMDTISSSNVPGSYAGDTPLDTLDIDALIALLPDELPRRGDHYLHIAKHWLSVGFLCVPSDGYASKVPAVVLGHLHGPNRRSPTPDELEEWAIVASRLDSEPLLLPCGLPGQRGLVFLDADHPEVRRWIETEAGHTPLLIETGRPEGGRHYVYRVAEGEEIPMSSGIIGPATPCKVKVDDQGREHRLTFVDVRGRHGYEAAVGGRHKSGAIYRAFWKGEEIAWNAITIEMLDNLPVLTRTNYDRIRNAAPFCGSRTVMRTVSRTAGAASSTSSGKAGTYRREVGDRDARIPGPGPYAEMTPHEAARVAGPGVHEIGCPFHPSVSGRSASLRVWSSGGHCISCHVEQVTYAFGTDVGVGPVAEPIDLDALFDDDEDAEDQPPEDDGDDMFHVADERLDEIEEAGFDADVPFEGLLDDLDNGQTYDSSDSVRRSPFNLSEGTAADKTTEKTGSTDIAPPAGLDRHRVERTTIDAGRSRFENKPIWCGVGKRVVGGKAGRLEVTRMPCNSFRCSVCGPRQVDALQAAAWAVVGSLPGEWRGVVLEIDMGEDKVTRGLRRWHAEAPNDRHYLGAAVDPETNARMSRTLAGNHGRAFKSMIAANSLAMSSSARMYTLPCFHSNPCFDTRVS